MVHTSTFGLPFGSLSPTVTLNIRSRSPKPNQLFIMSQCYIHANLAKIRQPVHEILCKQESVMPTPMLTLTPTGSAPKTKVPSPSVGDIIADADANRIRTKNIMSHSPSVGDIITYYIIRSRYCDITLESMCLQNVKTNHFLGGKYFYIQLFRCGEDDTFTL